MSSNLPQPICHSIKQESCGSRLFAQWEVEASY